MTQQPKRRTPIFSRTRPTATSKLRLIFSADGELIEFRDEEEPEPITALTQAPSPKPPKESEVTE